MMKKYLIAGLGLIMATAMLTGCGKKDDKSDNTKDDVNVETSQDSSDVVIGDESPDEWFSYLDSNTVMGLTDEGKKQKELVVPAHVTFIQSTAFKDSEAEKVSFANPDVEIEGYLFGRSYESEFNETLKSIVLPANMKEMPEGICYKCHALCDVVIPNGVTNVSKYAFACDISLVNISLPSSVKTIDEYAFHACTALERVTGAENLEVFGNSCFDMCDVLVEVPKSESLKTVEKDAFDYDHLLTEVYLPPCLETLEKAAFANTGIKKIDLSGTSITTIPESCFYNCTELEEVRLPKTIKEFEISSFFAVNGKVYVPSDFELNPVCGLHENDLVRE